MPIRFLLALSCFFALSASAVQLTSDTFARQANGAGLAEVQLGNMAIQKAQNPAVKAFAETMIKDHGQANTELETVAMQDGIRLPTTPPPDANAAADALRLESGPAFDRAYVARMVQDHEQAVALFRAAATQDGVNQDLRAFAQKTLPVLQHHMQEALQLDKQLGGAAQQSSTAPAAPVAVSAEVVP